ncbi:TPA: type II toxin-antitoxin system ParD family antitoxin [Mannheimia haemolytica]|uniref:Antitoxin ParD n=1 Tax=Mannheimia haemolytica TaxID=75985 RepID=A0A248ZZV9_MANHA|nr:type II toxin-antitoxin system ParD family antitoxin [Mannheimia haemolytica]AWW71221.1 type II toxin-antitoxin system ParD family antitoxin [Pasteurellaceae bacterium 12565]AGI32340.1 type II toxin-antitoxin system ParD family antitoxin [Mannheimia haemolytica USDA-ARS-USMARC-183]AGI35254.1 type II toxin-antitoxin system ParD family antitoxin [Mannheimia haemolytica USDA-ARS-USMARC-185]AGK02541.1 putative addiction module antidote protein [Mannheimia haemolytica M42548]AGQ24672.1 antitoxin
MSRTTSVTLAEPLSQFVNQMVESGRYGSTNEVISAALKILEAQEQQLIQLRALIDEGLESGVSEETVQSIISKAKRNV